MLLISRLEPYFQGKVCSFDRLILARRERRWTSAEKPSLLKRKNRKVESSVTCQLDALAVLIYRRLVLTYRNFSSFNHFNHVCSL